MESNVKLRYSENRTKGQVIEIIACLPVFLVALFVLVELAPVGFGVIGGVLVGILIYIFIARSILNKLYHKNVNITVVDKDYLLVSIDGEDIFLNRKDLKKVQMKRGGNFLRNPLHSNVLQLIMTDKTYRFVSGGSIREDQRIEELAKLLKEAT